MNVALAVVLALAVVGGLSFWLQRRSGIWPWRLRSQLGELPGPDQSTIEGDAWERTFPNTAAGDRPGSNDDAP